MFAQKTKMFWLTGVPLACVMVELEPPALPVYDPEADREKPMKAKSPKDTVLGPAFSVSLLGLLANLVTVPVGLMIAFAPILFPAPLAAMIQLA